MAWQIVAARVYQHRYCPPPAYGSMADIAWPLEAWFHVRKTARSMLTLPKTNIDRPPWNLEAGPSQQEVKHPFSKATGGHLLPQSLKCFRPFRRGRILPLQLHTQNHASVATRDYQGLLLLVSWRVRSFKFHSSLSWDASVSGTRFWTKINVKSRWTPSFGSFFL